jgi:NADH-quinone oxidoreductase subunit N
MINLLYDFLYYMAFGQKFEFYFFVMFSTFMMIIRIFQLVSLPIVAELYNLAFFVMVSSSLNAIIFKNFSISASSSNIFTYEVAVLKLITILFWFFLYFFIRFFYFEEFFEKSEFKLFSLDIALCGALYFVSANNLLEMFLGLELLAFPTYTLIGLEKTKAATESALKYFIYSVYGSLLLILSFIILFIATGQVSFTEFLMTTNPYLGEIAIILFCTAFMVKLGVGPFYHWAPPVYQSVSSTIFIFMSTVSKIPVLVGFIYAAQSALLTSNSWAMYYVSSLLIIGALMAAKDLLSENNLRRILAYTSTINFTIGLLGYFLSLFNIKVFLIYTSLYLVSNLAVYIWHLSLNSDRFQKEEISSINEFKKENYFSIFILNASLVMNSGLPPVTIFFFKLIAIGSISFWSTTGLNVLGLFISIFILISSLSSYNAYFKIIKSISYRKPVDTPNMHEEVETDSFKIFSFAISTTMLSIYIFFIALHFN